MYFFHTSACVVGLYMFSSETQSIHWATCIKKKKRKLEIQLYFVFEPVLVNIPDKDEAPQCYMRHTLSGPFKLQILQAFTWQHVLRRRVEGPQLIIQEKVVSLQPRWFFWPCFDKCTSIQIQETLVPYTRTCFSRVSVSGWNFPWKGKGLLLQWLVLLPELPSGQLLSDPCSSVAQLGYQQTQGIHLLSTPTTSSTVVKWVVGLWEFLSNRRLTVAMPSGIFCLLWSILLGI